MPNDDKRLDTGKFRRIVHEEVGDAMDNAAMKLEAVRVNRLMADNAELKRQNRELKLVLDAVRGLLADAVKTLAVLDEE